MKKFIFAFVASLAFMQSAPAALQNFGESLREYQAIIDARDLLRTKIKPREFIVEIERETTNLNASTVYYEIKTVRYLNNDVDAVVDNEEFEMSSCDHPRSNAEIRTYLVTLTLTQDVIGPPTITVDSIIHTSTRRVHVIVGEVENFK